MLGKCLFMLWTILFGHNFVIIIVVKLNYPEEMTLCCKLRAVMTSFFAP